MFFALEDRIERALLSDSNQELMTTYAVVRDDVEALMELLREHSRRYAEAARGTYYYQVRAAVPKEPMEVAARMIFLNRTCYNGLYRLNGKGRFNAAEGRHGNPDICNEARLRAASRALRKADLSCRDFEEIAPERGDSVYCDPPYDGGWTGYLAADFLAADQTRLQRVARRWTESGVDVVLSNADTRRIRTIYGADEWSLDEVDVLRRISIKASSRGKAPELIIASMTREPRKARLLA